MPGVVRRRPKKYEERRDAGTKRHWGRRSARVVLATCFMDSRAWFSPLGIAGNSRGYGSASLRMLLRSDSSTAVVFKDGCTLDLAVPLWRIAYLGTGHWGRAGMGWES